MQGPLKFPLALTLAADVEDCTVLLDVNVVEGFTCMPGTGVEFGELLEVVLASSTCEPWVMVLL